MKLEPRMRVRCVDDTGAADLLDKGREYTVESTMSGYVTLHGVSIGNWRADRFKPIIRVKARREDPPSIGRLLDAMLGKL